MSLFSALSRWLSVLLLTVIAVPALARPADTASIERLLKATHMQPPLARSMPPAEIRGQASGRYRGGSLPTTTPAWAKAGRTKPACCRKTCRMKSSDG